MRIVSSRYCQQIRRESWLPCNARVINFPCEPFVAYRISLAHFPLRSIAGVIGFYMGDWELV
jgi:hypothetical protein